MAQKFCLDCGEPLVEGKGFCGHCVARVEATGSGEPSREQLSHGTAKDPGEKQRADFDDSVASSIQPPILNRPAHAEASEEASHDEETVISARRSWRGAAILVLAFTVVAAFLGVVGYRLWAPHQTEDSLLDGRISIILPHGWSVQDYSGPILSRYGVGVASVWVGEDLQSSAEGHEGLLDYQGSLWIQCLDPTHGYRSIDYPGADESSEEWLMDFASAARRHSYSSAFLTPTEPSLVQLAAGQAATFEYEDEEVVGKVWFMLDEAHTGVYQVSYELLKDSDSFDEETQQLESVLDSMRLTASSPGSNVAVTEDDDTEQDNRSTTGSGEKGRGISLAGGGEMTVTSVDRVDSLPVGEQGDYLRVEWLVDNGPGDQPVLVEAADFYVTYDDVAANAWWPELTDLRLKAGQRSDLTMYFDLNNGSVNDNPSINSTDDLNLVLFIGATWRIVGMGVMPKAELDDWGGMQVEKFLDDSLSDFYEGPL